LPCHHPGRPAVVYSLLGRRELDTVYAPHVETTSRTAVIAASGVLAGAITTRVLQQE